MAEDGKDREHGNDEENPCQLIIINHFEILMSTACDSWLCILNPKPIPMP